jgi:hypothetical protein
LSRSIKLEALTGRSTPGTRRLGSDEKGLVIRVGRISGLAP